MSLNQTLDPFAEILREAVERTPRALGGAFAAYDGELVGSFSDADPTDWAILTAHYGVLWNHVQRALLTFHYGEAQSCVLSHSSLDILVHSVAEGYYILLAIHHPAPLAAALVQLDSAVLKLQKEMS